ncbi:hypothetical protein C8R47DRAFT_142394 [Mycena vitilis]|nr:hypothetical protein C8R47DRAFT_142394 [Mycena vitilis]
MVQDWFKIQDSRPNLARARASTLGHARSLKVQSRLVLRFKTHPRYCSAGLLCFIYHHLTLCLLQIVLPHTCFIYSSSRIWIITTSYVSHPFIFRSISHTIIPNVPATSCALHAPASSDFNHQPVLSSHRISALFSSADGTCLAVRRPRTQNQLP